MDYKKQLFVRIIFLAELCLFTYGYVWGKQGIINLYERKKVNALLLQQLAHERTVLEELSALTVAWNDDFFYKERYARENLHMGRKEDIVYISE
jgi:Septum formation initiator